MQFLRTNSFVTRVKTIIGIHTSLVRIILYIPRKIWLVRYYGVTNVFKYNNNRLKEFIIALSKSYFNK